MDELEYLSRDQLLIAKVAECAKMLNQLSVAMNEASTLLTEMLNHLNQNNENIISN